MRIKILAIVLLLVVGAGALVVGLGGLPSTTAATTSYLTSTARVTDVSDDVAATGSIAASATWSLGFGVAATTGTLASPSGSTTGAWDVSAVDVAVGQVVRKDQVLATATNPTLKASVDAAIRSRSAARIQLVVAQDAAAAATGTAAIRSAKTALLQATNSEASAGQAAADLTATAARNRLIAPADGIVTAVAISAGAEAPAGTAITLETTSYQVTAAVVESDITKMKVGQPASVTVAALGSTIDGTVSAIAPTAAASSGSSSVVSFDVTVALKAPPADLRAGMTADVTITSASATGVLAVPAAAIRGTAGNYTVLVLTTTGTTRSAPVTLGLMTSTLVEVTSGLAEGDVVVTGTASTQRTTTGTGAGGIGIPGGGGGFRGGGGN